MEHRLLEWLTHYGTPLVFVAQVFGIFGLPVPDEFMLTVAGALARNGELRLHSLIVAAIGGAATGITLSYLLGRTVGTAALHRLGHVSADAIDRTHRWFDRFGHWLLTFGYFVPGVRHVTAIAAGSTDMSFTSFAAFAYPGAVVWSMTFVGLGYYAGHEWRAALAATRSWLLPAGVVAAGIIVAISLWRPSPART